MNIDSDPSQGPVAGPGRYRTRPVPPPLNRWLHCFWQLEVDAGRYCYRSVPDNSIDWIMNLDEPEDSFLVAPFASPLVFEIDGPAGTLACDSG